MWPSVRPNLASRSTGVRTWRWRISRSRPGMCSSRMAVTRSPSFSLSVSHVPRRSAYGAYCPSSLHLDPRDPSVGAHDSAPLRPRSDRHAGGPRRLAEGGGEGAHAAPHERRGGAMDVRPEPRDEPECGPRREWSFEGAEETIDREARLQQLRLEPLVQEIPDRHGGEAEHLLHHPLAEASQWKRTAHERHLLPEARRWEGS